MVYTYAFFWHSVSLFTKSTYLYRPSTTVLSSIHTFMNFHDMSYHFTIFLPSSCASVICPSNSQGHLQEGSPGGLRHRHLPRRRQLWELPRLASPGHQMQNSIGQGRQGRQGRWRNFWLWALGLYSNGSNSCTTCAEKTVGPDMVLRCLKSHEKPPSLAVSPSVALDFQRGLREGNCLLKI